MKWNRFKLRQEWYRRMTSKTRFLGNVDITDPNIRAAIEFSWLMGYNARERQENWQNASVKANADRRTKV